MTPDTITATTFRVTPPPGRLTTLIGAGSCPRVVRSLGWGSTGEAAGRVSEIAGSDGLAPESPVDVVTATTFRVTRPSGRTADLGAAGGCRRSLGWGSIREVAGRVSVGADSDGLAPESPVEVVTATTFRVTRPSGRTADLGAAGGCRRSLGWGSIREVAGRVSVGADRAGLASDNPVDVVTATSATFRVSRPSGRIADLGAAGGCRRVVMSLGWGSIREVAGRVSVGADRAGLASDTPVDVMTESRACSISFKHDWKVRQVSADIWIELARRTSSRSLAVTLLCSFAAQTGRVGAGMTGGMLGLGSAAVATGEPGRSASDTDITGSNRSVASSGSSSL